MFATGGYTTNQVEAHFDSVIALANKPDFCLIYTGANTDTTAQIGVYAMVRIIKKLMAASILPVIGVAQGGDSVQPARPDDASPEQAWQLSSRAVARCYFGSGPDRRRR